jgi:predicted DNA-binding mobile mystery protein A
MRPDKTIQRQRLDRRLGVLGLAIGARPESGWLREIRLALSMSTVELGQRMNISQPRASKLERAEVDETLRLSTLRRAAAALNCTLFYALVPNEPFEEMVLRQAHAKATQELMNSARHRSIASDSVLEEEMDEWLEMRTLDLVDRRGFWH